ncbi:HNH endonuclease [Pseudomonas sp. PONIH3]|uniref:HNH endonuclease n=1 Tax=Pseudomonas sp. PONIH3 TaxID=1636610 RepID=UPI003D282B1B
MDTNKMRAKPTPSIEYLRECFQYNPNSGVVIWKKRPLHHFPTARGMNRSNSGCAGKAAGCEDKGYLKVRLNGQNYFLHRVAFALVHGRWPGSVDHIDGNGLNNAIENLREVTHQENMRNQARRRDSRTPVMGVSWHRSQQRWHAYIGAGGSLERLGSHDTIFEAVCARKSAELRHGFHENHGRIHP